MTAYGLPPEIDAGPTIRVVMLKDEWGCPDACSRVLYNAGQEYDLPEELAQCFFSTHSADPAEAHQQLVEAPKLTQEAPASDPVAQPTPSPANLRPAPRQTRRKA